MFSFFGLRRVDPKQRLARVLGKAALPSFKGVILEALETLRDPSASAQEVARVLEADPGLSVRILKIVNSAAYSLSRSVDSLQQAISLMGMANVESLVLAVGVSSALPACAQGAFDPARFWRLAGRRATVSRALASRLHPGRQAEAFTAALLQDLAVPLLVTHGPRDYGTVFEEGATSGRSLHEVERERYGWDHAEVGTWICAEWALPESLAACVGAHHGDDLPAALDAVSISALLSEDHGATPQLIAAAERAGLLADEVVPLIEHSSADAERVSELLGLES